MEKIRVVLYTETDGEIEKIEGIGEYISDDKSFKIEFQSDGVLFQLINKDKLTLIRNGEISYRFDFEEGTSVSSVIKTPYGEIPVDVFTDMVRIKFDTGYASVFVSYSMVIAGEKSEHKMSVSVTKIKRAENED